MAQTIRRKPTGVRRQARAQGTKRQVRKAKAKTNSLVDALMRVLPFTEEQLHKFFLVVILAAAAVLAWVVASLAGLTLLLEQKVAVAAANAGFEVHRVEVRGVERLNELKVYERVLGERERAMPQVDLHALRASVMELSWVEDARVSRQLPDRIVIDVVERTPHAALRKPRIDADNVFAGQTISLRAEAVQRANAVFGETAIQAHVPFAARAIRARHGVRLPHDAAHPVTRLQP